MTAPRPAGAVARMLAAALSLTVALSATVACAPRSEPAVGTPETVQASAAHPVDAPAPEAPLPDATPGPDVAGTVVETPPVPAEAPAPAEPAAPSDDLPAGDASASPPPLLPDDPNAPVPPPAPEVPYVYPPTIRYVVVPHPDDEFQGWSAFGGSTDYYVVYVLLTKGERTAYCTGSGLVSPNSGDQSRHYERIPHPSDFLAAATDCKDRRVDAWHAFLDQMARVDPAAGNASRVGTFTAAPPAGEVPSRPEGGGRVPALDYDLWIGARSARVVFDLGDRDLTSAEVTWALQTVRGLRGTQFPPTDEWDVIGASYYNPDPGWGGIVYDHPDHAAVHDALRDTDQGTPGPQLARTAPGDPARSQTLTVPPFLFCAVMCVDPLPIDPVANPTARRTGLLQWAYGWLAAEYWAGALSPAGSMFSQSQDFWQAW